MNSGLSLAQRPTAAAQNLDHRCCTCGSAITNPNEGAELGPPLVLRLRKPVPTIPLRLGVKHLRGMAFLPVPWLSS